ncbi:methyltransferase domain-containing protein [Saccharopolyspora aridisoli]|uniref:Methyltransferase domain-containing protein n=1 Tax=Saccharopolyspora aridisoli TaxID=2530385 RepID=A0A4R4UWQ6_9PSEU|nr:methyltransferase domain-containing protein [Saccharopolyspora aridisoli]TDC91289.1 methyltransferase domain-containing protein [Saccharopolyspora aridisoli]
MPEKSSTSNAEAVGRLYDRFAAESRDLWPDEAEVPNFGFGEHLHFGYWETPDEDAPLDVAAMRLTDMVIDRLRVDEAHHVLDVGCGIGGPALRTARRTGARVTGITVSESQIEQAKALAQDADLAGRLDFRLADALNMPFRDGSFDAVFALESMMHMPDRPQVLGEIARVLRPGGRVVLTDFFERAPIPEVHRPFVDLLRESSLLSTVRVEDYPSMLRGSGMLFEEIVDISPHTTRRTFIEMSRPWTEWAAAHPEVGLGTALAAGIPAPGLIDVEELGYLLLVAQRP